MLALNLKDNLVEYNSALTINSKQRILGEEFKQIYHMKSGDYIIVIKLVTFLHQELLEMIAQVQ